MAQAQIADDVANLYKRLTGSAATTYQEFGSQSREVQWLPFQFEAPPVEAPATVEPQALAAEPVAAPVEAVTRGVAEVAAPAPVKAAPVFATVTSLQRAQSQVKPVSAPEQLTSLDRLFKHIASPMEGEVSGLGKQAPLRTLFSRLDTVEEAQTTLRGLLRKLSN